jgi:sulfoxide reductase heme-binding subunit YedZ
MKEHSGETKHLAHPRLLTHILLGSALVTFYLFAAHLVQGGRQIELLVIVLGYLCLSLACVSLVIGPLSLLRWRRNPVNIDLRRDIGIWSGITGCLHVLLVLRGRIQGTLLLLYFLHETPQGYAPLFTIYGVSNDAGLLAAILLLLLLATSNTASLRYLKGKRWKLLQRLTYLLIPLILIHTFGYQYLNLRGPLFVWSVIALSLLVLICQSLGIALTLTRQKRH